MPYGKISKRAIAISMFHSNSLKPRIARFGHPKYKKQIEMKNPFPDFVGKLPKIDYGIEGLIVHADRGGCGETYFVYAGKEIAFPEHSHGAQWTVVIQGKCDFTANGETRVYKKGDTYNIPGGMRHQIA